MQDRVPMYPGRVRLTPVPGQDGLYDMVRADQPTQEGTPLNKATLLSDGTAAVYGLGNDAVPDDVFLILGVGSGKYGYGITVQYPDGTPAAGLSVSGVTDRLGQPIKTDKNGFLLAVSTATSITFSLESPYFDISGISGCVVDSTAVVTRQTVEFTYKSYGNYALITNTQAIKFSRHYNVDFTAVGGGGGTVGWTNKDYTSYGAGSAGGGGGYVTTELGYQVWKDEVIEIQIGAGGTTIAPTSAGNYVGGPGGQTQLSKNAAVFLSANGGFGGQGYLDGRDASPSSTLSGGGGNGNGGGWSKASSSSGKGADGSGYIFNDPNLGVAGGGGGGGGPYFQTNAQGVVSGAAGGAPYGSRGCEVIDFRTMRAHSPTGPGGGAGGSYGDSNMTAIPGSGHAGAVYLRWR